MAARNEPQQTLLVVEDDQGLQKQLKWALHDYRVVVAGEREAAIAAARREEPAVIALDLGLPPDSANASEGLAALEAILTLLPHTKIIVVTGNDDHDNAVKAVGLGAYDYYQKPIDIDELRLIVARAFQLSELEAENRRLAYIRDSSPLAGIIARSENMLQLCRKIERLAAAEATVLVLGESGTGKELVAKALHSLSARAKQRFVAINCAAIPGELLESELFGYEKGAFTGAVKQTIGKIEHAHGGTLFLDEIGDLSFALQAKLLRFLQERVVERIGGRQEIPVDVRIICATHQDLAHLIAHDQFREDLYYRISEISLTLPPLREREGDAILLARAFLERFAQLHKGRIKGFTQEALQALETYAWPGNVRELENRVKNATIMADGSQITAQDLNLDPADNDVLDLNLRRARERTERRLISQAMSLAGDNVSQASEYLGVKRPTLYSLLDKYGMRGS